MVKKKISGQTIAIIALAVLLILTIGFGGVFAYFSTTSNSVTGKITMANLNIDLQADHEEGSGSSDKSEIILSSTNVLPDQKLENSPLVVMNSSDADVYLIVVYRVEATKEDENGQEIEVKDTFDGCLIDLDIDYVNNKHSKIKEHYDGQLDHTRDTTKGTDWVDYVFTYVSDNNTPADPSDDKEYNYRCLVCLKKQNAPAEGSTNKITVIEKDTLGLHQDMDNNYQTSSLTFTFQAYVIGAGEGFVEEINSMSSVEEKCHKIVSETYESQDFTFLNVSATR